MGGLEWGGEENWADQPPSHFSADWPGLAACQPRGRKKNSRLGMKRLVTEGGSGAREQPRLRGFPRS